MNFTTETETATAAQKLVDELVAVGYIVSEVIPVSSTHKLTKGTDGIDRVVKMKLTEKKIDVFFGARQNDDILRHETWRIKSDKKKAEVSWKICSSF